MNMQEKMTALYEKMNAEQTKYRDWLLAQPPKAILEHTYEYTVREDIVMAVENQELTDAQADVLLALDGPLAAIYKDFSKRETSYMEVIADCISGRADAELKKAEESREAQRDLPVYPHTGKYALEHGETDRYLASYRANVACRDAIDSAVNSHFDGFRLESKAAVGEVVDKFGFDRALRVCAYSIREQEWDGRISSGNVTWERSLNLEDDVDTYGKPHQTDYTLNGISAGLLNLFVKELRREYALTLPLSGQEISAEAKRICTEIKAASLPNSPSGTHFMVRISSGFEQRADKEDMKALCKILPFKGIMLSKLQGDETISEGTYALLSGDADRSKPFREPRASVLEKLKKPHTASSPKHSAKSRQKER